MKTAEDSYNASVKKPISEIVTDLNTVLGPTLVAALAGTSNRENAHRWANTEGPHPRPAAENRLRAAYRIFDQIADNESAAVARAFFIGANPNLHEGTIITAIREDRFADALAATQSFLEDAFGS